MTVAHRIVLGDDPGAWEALGFATRDGACRVGPLELAFDGRGGGVRRLELAALGDPPAALPVAAGPPPREDVPAVHPNGATGIDHLVVLTPGRDPTVAVLRAAGGDVRRVGGPPELPAPMAFLRFGPLIVEVAETPRSPAAAFWGLTVVVGDLDALAERAGERLNAISPARQAGRRITTARPAAEIGAALAFMDGERTSGS